jgi:hypothetical protein
MASLPWRWNKKREIDIDGRGMRGTAPWKNPTTTTFINAETRSDRLMAVNASDT